MKKKLFKSIPIAIVGRGKKRKVIKMKLYEFVKEESK